MKNLNLMFFAVFASLISSKSFSADLACPNFSGNFIDQTDGTAYRVQQSGCAGITINATALIVDGRLHEDEHGFGYIAIFQDSRFSWQHIAIHGGNSYELIWDLQMINQQESIFAQIVDPDDGDTQLNESVLLPVRK
jgi:hypothetical protein